MKADQLVSVISLSIVERKPLKRVLIRFNERCFVNYRQKIDTTNVVRARGALSNLSLAYRQYNTKDWNITRSEGVEYIQDTTLVPCLTIDNAYADLEAGEL